MMRRRPRRGECARADGKIRPRATAALCSLAVIEGCELQLGSCRVADSIVVSRAARGAIASVPPSCWFVRFVLKYLYRPAEFICVCTRRVPRLLPRET